MAPGKCWSTTASAFGAAVALAVVSLLANTREVHFPLYKQNAFATSFPVHRWPLGKRGEEGEGEGSSGEQRRHVDSTYIPEVIVYLAGGAVASSHLFGASLETLGRYGGWRGTVVVVTDLTECVIAGQVPRARAAGLDVKVVQMEKVLHTALPKTGKWDRSLAKSKVMYYKLQKSKLWYYVERAGMSGVRWLLYMDEDILIGREVWHMRAAMVETLVEHPQAQIVLFHQQQQKHRWLKKENMHTGVIMVQNGTGARHCLVEWGRVYASGAYGRDQSALAGTDCAMNGTFATMPPDNLLQFPDSDNMAARQRDVFIHFTNSHRMMRQDLRSAIKTYWSEVLHLDTDPWGRNDCSGV